MHGGYKISTVGYCWTISGCGRDGGDDGDGSGSAGIPGPTDVYRTSPKRVLGITGARNSPEVRRSVDPPDACSCCYWKSVSHMGTPNLRYLSQFRRAGAYNGKAIKPPLVLLIVQSVRLLGWTGRDRSGRAAADGLFLRGFMK